MKIKTVEFVTSAVRPEGYPREKLPEIAFAGRSNVGKSSMINALVNRRALAKVSGTPGRTRLINFFKINDGIHFVDLPGYGYAKVSMSMRAEWKGLVERYLLGSELLRAIVVILDARHKPTAMDCDLVDWLHLQGIPMIPVATKSDKLSKNNLQKQLALISKTLDLAPGELESFSVKDGQSRARLWRRINEAIHGGGTDRTEAVPEQSRP